MVESDDLSLSLNLSPFTNNLINSIRFFIANIIFPIQI